MTVPRTIAAFVVVTLLSPLLAVLAVIVDATRGAISRKPWMATRLVAFIWVYLAIQTALLVAAGAVWAGTGAGRLIGARRYERIHFALQGWALGRLFAFAVVVLGLRFEVEDAGVAAPGPIVLMLRHASLVDVLLPGALVANPNGINLRYVLKRELLQDPMMDIVGNRLPNHFVARGGTDTTAEVRAVRRLAAGLRDDEGVVIYPEGTRFTEAKRARALERLAAGDPDLYARAQKLRHVLPPRVGGPRALLEGAPRADVVFCAHDGLGGFAELGDLWSGGLVGQRVRVTFWRVPAAEVPERRREQMYWLFDQWARVDEWIEQQRERAAREG